MANVDTDGPVGSVAWAQASLNALGATPPLLVDGVMREEMERELLAVQKAHGRGIPIDGKLTVESTAAIMVALATKVVDKSAPGPARVVGQAPVLPRLPGESDADYKVRSDAAVKVAPAPGPALAVKMVMPVWPSLPKNPGESDADYNVRNEANKKRQSDDWRKANP